jgi:tetratricopeptide (TPR) repeat protein
LLLLVAAGSLAGSWLIWRQKEQTTTALGVAQTNAERADANLRHALDALEKIYLQVDEKQWPAQSQFDRPDQALLEQMVQFYEKFAQENNADPAVKRETAKAYRRVADIYEKLRRWAEAKEAYGRAITFLRQLAEEQPKETEVLSDLAQRYHDLATLLSQRGPPQEAEQAYREAIAVYEKLVQADGSSKVVGHRGELAECLYNLSHHLRRNRRAEEAEPLSRRATELVEKLRKETPNDPDGLHHLGVALQLWAEVRMDARQYAEARPLLEQAVRRQRAAADAKPGQVRYLTSLGNHYEWLVRVLNFLQQPAAAEEALRQQVVLSEQVAKALPNVPGHRYQLANSYTVLALHVHAAGRYTEAEKIYRQALEINRDLATVYPNKQFCQRHLGLNYHLLGALFRDMGRPEEAEQLHRQGLIAMARKPSSYHEQADFQIVVAQALGNLVGPMFHQGERSLALHFLELATQYQEAALKAKPNHKPYLQALGRARSDLFWELVPYPDPQFLHPRQMLDFAKRTSSWQMYGIAAYRLGDCKDAIAKLEKSLESGTEITKVSAWFFLAMANERLGEHEKARSWYAKAVQVMDNPPPAWSSIDYRRLIYDDLRRFRAEAAGLIGIKDQPMPKGNQEPTANN